MVLWNRQCSLDRMQVRRSKSAWTIVNLHAGRAPAAFVAADLSTTDNFKSGGQMMICIEIVVWPRIREISSTGIPPCSNRVAPVRRRSLMRRSFTSAVRFAVLHDRLTPLNANSRSSALRFWDSHQVFNSRANLAEIGAERSHKVLAFICWTVTLRGSKSRSLTLS